MLHQWKELSPFFIIRNISIFCLNGEHFEAIRFEHRLDCVYTLIVTVAVNSWKLFVYHFTWILHFEFQRLKNELCNDRPNSRTLEPKNRVEGFHWIWIIYWTASRGISLVWLQWQSFFVQFCVSIHTIESIFWTQLKHSKNTFDFDLETCKSSKMRLTLFIPALHIMLTRILYSIRLIIQRIFSFIGIVCRRTRVLRTVGEFKLLFVWDFIARFYIRF